MKTLLLAATVSLATSAATAQEKPQAQSDRVAESTPVAADAWLGISLETDGRALRVNFVVAGSPAAKAGVKEGSYLIGIAGKNVVDDPRVVVDAVRARRPGDEVELQWRFENDVKAARIALGSRPTGIEEEADRLKKPEEDTGGKAPDRDPEWRGYRFVPLPEPKPGSPAERQLRKLPPEVQINPFEKARKEGEEEWQAAPPFQAVPDFPKQEAPVPDVELDPYKERRASGPDRRDFDLNAEPSLKNGEERYFVPSEKLRMTSPGQWEEMKQGHKADRTGPPDENAVWEQVEKRVAGALQRSDLDPGVQKKVLQALEEARRAKADRDGHVRKMEEEIQKLENQAREALEHARKLRRDLDDLRRQRPGKSRF